MALEQARELLTTRYGPAPGYVWVAGIAGVTFLVVRRRRRAGSDTAGDGDAGASSTSEQDEPAPFDYGPGADAASSFLPPGMPAPTANPAPVAQPPMLRRGTGPLGRTSRQRHVYTVRRGDTIGTIARRFHTTAAKISQANPAIKRNPTGRISVGEVLVIP